MTLKDQLVFYESLQTESFIYDPLNVLDSQRSYAHKIKSPNNSSQDSPDHSEFCLESTNFTSPDNTENEEIEDSTSLLNRSKKIKKPKAENQKLRAPSKKGLWGPKDDSLLIILVKEHGQKWAKLAKMMPGKARRQIRNRYLNALRPGINWGEWTQEEEKRLYELHEDYGNQWCEIAAHLPGRTENQVKNKFYWSQKQLSQMKKTVKSKRKTIIQDLTVNLAPKYKELNQNKTRPEPDGSCISVEDKMLFDMDLKDFLRLEHILAYLNQINECNISEDTHLEDQSNKAVLPPRETFLQHDLERHLNSGANRQICPDVDQYFSF